MLSRFEKEKTVVFVIDLSFFLISYLLFWNNSPSNIFDEKYVGAYTFAFSIARVLWFSSENRLFGKDIQAFVRNRSNQVILSLGLVSLIFRFLWKIAFTQLLQKDSVKFLLVSSLFFLIIESVPVVKGLRKVPSLKALSDDLFSFDFVSSPLPKHRKGTSVRRLLELAWPERYLLSLAMVCLLIASSSSLKVPKIFGMFITTVSEEKAKEAVEDLNNIIGSVIFFLCISGFFGMLRGVLFNLCGERILARLRIALFRKVIYQDIGFFDQSEAGELQSRLGSDCGVLQRCLTSNISRGLMFLSQAFFSAGMLFVTSWKLSLVMLSVLPALSIGSKQYGKFRRSLAKIYRQYLADASVRAAESFSLIRTIQCFSKEEQQIESYSECIRKAYFQGLKKSIAFGVFIGAIEVAGKIAIALILWVGAQLVISETNSLSTGDLSSCMFYAMTAASALKQLTGIYSDIMNALGASERIFVLLDREETVTSGALVIDRDTFTSDIEFRNVAFRYPARIDAQVLEDLSFIAVQNQITALVGPSGAGKSTIVSLILRCYDPTKGSILIGGQDLRNFDLKSLRSMISVVSQEPLLFSTSILENIAFGSIENSSAVSNEDVILAATKAHADGFISNFPEGYDSFVGEKGLQLSGGQKQRVAIARAILRKPKILLLDEATSALDSGSEKVVQEALDRLMFGERMSSIVIAHRLSTVKRASKIVVIDNGSVAQQGPHKQLMQDENGIYYNLVQKQNL